MRMRDTIYKYGLENLKLKNDGVSLFLQRTSHIND